MRVWLLTSEMAPDVAGGIATYVDAFARLLGADGHEVTVLGASLTARDETVAPGVRLVGLPRRVPSGIGVSAGADGRVPSPYDVLAPPAARAVAARKETLAPYG